jgi:antitoxin component YwqK of YwqJK toxin-antitoxin module
MDSLPIEIIETIFLLVNPKDYTNFILSYDVALCFWRNKKIREKYKEQYLRVVRKDFVTNSGMYFIKTIRIDNGKTHGKYTVYHKNDQIWMNTTYVNNQKHGEYTRYYENGQLREDTTYRNNQRHGKYTRYYENGQICVDTTYQIIHDISRIHGKYTKFYEDGSIWIDATY